MRKLIPFIALVALAFAAATALGASKRPAKVGLARSSLGKIIVNGSGRTLYLFTKDARNKDKCGAISGCSSSGKRALNSATIRRPSSPRNSA